GGVPDATAGRPDVQRGGIGRMRRNGCCPPRAVCWTKRHPVGSSNRLRRDPSGCFLGDAVTVLCPDTLQPPLRIDSSIGAMSTQIEPDAFEKNVRLIASVFIEVDGVAFSFVS